MRSTGEAKLFREIEQERYLISYISGLDVSRYLKTSFRYNCFAHVLSKNKYPELRLNKDNIVLLTPEEHYLYDNGTEKQRKDYAFKMRIKGLQIEWNRLYDKRKKIKEYSKLK